jgi:ferritin-like metal-binding protein YciE
MFERLNTPQEAYNYKLGAALKMERTVLEMLEDNEKSAQDERVAHLFRHHRDETRQQIANLERAFAAFGWDVDDSPCPAIEGIQKEGKANAKKTDDAIVDSVLLMGGMETEHHEIAVYEGLIINARAMGREDVVRLLQQNLEQEEHTLSELKETLHKVATVSPKQPA